MKLVGVPFEFAALVVGISVVVRLLRGAMVATRRRRRQGVSERHDIEAVAVEALFLLIDIFSDGLWLRRMKERCASCSLVRRAGEHLESAMCVCVSA